ncbi:MAG TPA: trypsin-like peptidase domain-containing protein [Streptosporangiaceae bacterium]|nr:trypsin-like peptidase domain-containing protein [Streptosporangiaceae bacterium]
MPHRTRHPRRRRFVTYVLAVAITAAVSAVATVALREQPGDGSSVLAQGPLPAPHDNAPGTGSGNLNKAEVERAVDPGLVDITARLKYDSETAEGTGMIVSADGLVLTNNHVIDNSTSISAQLVRSGRVYQAQVVGYDASADIALLRLVGARELPVVTFGNSSQLTVGTPVLALGNAEGRGGATPAGGLISALGRSIDASDQGSGTTEDLPDMEQTTAQIQQGDSGGALANNAGQVVGMITAANSASAHQGGTIGFAIPIDSARAIAQQIAEGQASTAVYIGVPGFLGVVVPASKSASPHRQASDEQHFLDTQRTEPGLNGPGDAACIDVSSQVSVPTRIAPATRGVLIVDIFCGTAVSQAGLVPGDVITSISGTPVTVPTSLGAALGKYHPGQTISLRWIDTGGTKHNTPIALGAGPVRLPGTRGLPGTHGFPGTHGVAFVTRFVPLRAIPPGASAWRTRFWPAGCDNQPPMTGWLSQPCGGRAPYEVPQRADRLAGVTGVVRREAT